MPYSETPARRSNLMDKTYKAIIALLVLALACDAGIYHINKKTIDRLNEKLLRSHELSQYLASKLDENGVERTVFDKIVIETLRP